MKEISKETREAFLYGQLQESLRNDLMQSPSVSGALSYQELCMAAKNEEKELRKRRTYRSTSTPAPDQSQKRDSVKRRDGEDSVRVQIKYSIAGVLISLFRLTLTPVLACTSQLPGVCCVS